MGLICCNYKILKFKESQNPKDFKRLLGANILTDFGLIF